MNHPKYKTIKKSLNDLRSLENSVIERTYEYEANYYIERLQNRNEGPRFPIVFAKYSKDYLVDETIKYILIQQKINNNLEFYYFGLELKHNTVFNGKKAKNNNIIQNYIVNELQGVTNGNWVTIRNKESLK